LFFEVPFEVPYLKLPVVSREETIKALHKAGFRVVRQKGSHVRMEKRTDKGVVKVTVPLHPSLKKGTLRVILKQAGLSVEEFVKLL
jgi:predicted RNA binding protein YcfA (HicA-like mRNA interferase family)